MKYFKTITVGWLKLFVVLMALTSSIAEASTYIRGMVTDAQGIPLQGVLVNAYDAQTMNLTAGVYTDNDGVFQIDRTLDGGTLPFGEYKIQAIPNEDYKPKWYDNILNLTETVPFIEEVTIVVQAKSPLGTINGTITDKVSGAVVPSAFIYIDALNRSTQSDQNGQFSFVVPVGTYAVRVTKEGYHEKTLSSIIVTEGQTNTLAIQLEKIRPGSVSGTVIDTNNNPIDGVRAFLKGTAYETVTDTGGHYSLLNIPPGDYTLRFEAPNYNPAEVSVSIPEDGTTVHDQVLELILNPGILEGYVKDSVTNATISGAYISLKNTTCEAQSGPDGSFRIQCEPGEHTVRIEKERYRATEETISIPNGGTLRKDFKISPFARLTGSVKDSVLGLAILGANVRACGFQTLTDQNGLYELYIPAGNCTVEASKYGYKTAQNTVSISWGDDRQIDFQLEPSATIRGLITDSITGDPLSGAIIKAGPYSAQSGIDGKYAFKVLPGDYSVNATRYPCYQSSNTTISIIENQSATLNFKLDPAGEISGTLKNATGNVTIGVWDSDSLALVRSEDRNLDPSNPQDVPFNFKLPCGTYFLAALKDGQILWWEDNTTGEREITVDESALIHRDLVLSFPQKDTFGKITGTVSNIPPGLAYSEVWAYSDLTGGFGTGAIADNGTYSITELIPADDYLVVIFLGNDNTPVFYNGVNFALDPEQATLVSVEAGNVTSNIDFDLKSFLHYSLTVRILSGLKEGELYRIRALSDEVDKVITFIPNNEDVQNGISKTLRLPQGRYLISVEGPEGVYYYAGNDTDGIRSPNDAIYVEITNADESISLKYPVPLVFSICGSIAGLAPLGESEILATAWSNNSGFQKSISLNPGDNDTISYCISGLPANPDYKLGLYLKNRDLHVYWKANSIVFKPENADLIDLSSNNATNIDFSLSSLIMGELYGTITGLEPGERISLIVSNSTNRKIVVTRANLNGIALYRLKMPTGTYTLVCWPRRHKPQKRDGIFIAEGGKNRIDFSYTPIYEADLSVLIKGIDRSYRVVLAFAGEEYYDKAVTKVNETEANATVAHVFKAPSGNYTAFYAIYHGDDLVAYDDTNVTIAGANIVKQIGVVDLSGIISISANVTGISPDAGWVDILILDSAGQYYSGAGGAPDDNHQLAHDFQLPSGTYQLKAVQWDANMTVIGSLCEFNGTVTNSGTYKIDCSK
ncbi:Outer membrane protein [Dissulfuribacter thermophilus]|uniref:Outer membrane protein n=1 Tax=Dissulfuribacter thermophilus TaxID=1156395 RepID=A0A1B9F4E0_9BACT|nr:carboxypeptidase regulatory-like domain-containing protein [Dissulfuribacter thermophilus]OCC14685.1 Outer membrane protein [Dissulfuribacter thermophilus]